MEEVRDRTMDGRINRWIHGWKDYLMEPWIEVLFDESMDGKLMDRSMDERFKIGRVNGCIRAWKG